ncbi:MAG: aldo/keto reductase [Dehalococcoidales bacterium]|nr:aldo/keto reductase [Dehalococcoidales bacterium]
MEYRKIGNTDLNVSVISIGGDTFGVAVDEAGTEKLIDCAIDCGINYIDTADVYGRMKSEEYLGKALNGKRSKVIIATKVGAAVGPGKVPFARPDGLGKREYIMQAIEDSLKRLDTDYIDLYQFHMPDPATPIEETLGALEDLVKAGKIRYFGCSNLLSWELCESLYVSKMMGTGSFQSIQSRFSLLDRYVEDELIPCCRTYNVSLIPWFPLAGGVLTGKYRRGMPLPEGTRVSVNPEFYAGYLNDGSYDLLEKFEAFAAERGHTILELAFAWLLGHPVVPTVIAGATKIEQVKSNAAASAWKMTPEDMQALDKAIGYQPYSMRPLTLRQWGTPSQYRRTA